ncbi:MAG: sugar:proton symporter [Planctomycetes bacterium]|nr:sugar:proton symporter [Planctomycetota bacterium]
MNTLIGIGWTLLGAVFLGTFALPSKYIKKYAWENTWGAFFLFAMFVVPVGFAAVVVKDLWAGYADVPGLVIFEVMALSFLWGCGFCCWGYGLARLGLSIGYSLTMGTMALVGSMVPFFLGNAAMATTLPGMIVIGGILVCILGVGINGYAGVQREKSTAAARAEQGGPVRNVPLGIFICILAGVLSSGLNIAFHIGNNVGGIAAKSEALGNPAWLAGLSTWTLVFLGGMISSVGYSAILLFKNRSWAGFAVAGSGRNIFLALLMAIGHFACIFFYGIGGWKLGVLGTSVGFAIFQSGSLLLGNGLGVFTGEWKGASPKSKSWLVIGLAVLILGIVIVSCGNAISS